MSKTIKTISDVFEPYASIIAYKTEGEYGNQSYYLEHRKIRNGKMGVGKPLTEDMLRNIILKLKTTSDQLDLSIHGVVPSNVLYCDTRIESDRLVWWRGPEERYLYFQEGLEIPSGKMKVPGLVYEVRRNGLMVYAFKGKKPSKLLYHAPFMNVSDYVCLGNAKVKKPTERTFEKVIAYWEKMFWNSEFSHILGANPVNGNLATITKHCIESGDPFPEDALKLYKGKKLNDLLK